MTKEDEFDSRQVQAIIFCSNQSSFLDHLASSPLVVVVAFPGGEEAWI